MKKDFYIETLKELLKRSFNLEENKLIKGKLLPLYGFWTEEFGRTLFSKDKVIDRYECNEHCIVKEFNGINESELQGFINYLKETSKELVKPHIEHKTTYMTGILICNQGIPIDLKVKRVIEKFKATKNYRFSLYGWCIFRLVVIDVQGGKVYYSKDAKDIGEKLSKGFKTKEVMCM